MSEFLDRNKKKGSLAALLLFLKRGKGLGPFLAMAMVLGAIFILPSGLSDSPWLLSFADKLGLSSLLGLGKGDHDSLTFQEALARARGGRNPDDSASTAHRIPPPDPSTIHSSVGLIVKDPAKDAPSVDEKAVDTGGKTVQGVVRPEDANKTPGGVALNEDEIRNGLMNNTNVAKMTGGMGNFGNSSSGQNSATSGASFGSGRAADRNAGMLASAMGGNVPSVGASGRQGKLDLGKTARPKVSLAPGSRPGDIKPGGTAMMQLAQGRAFSLAAAPPPGYCPQGSCPNEFAMNTSGVVFDGKKQPTQGIIGAPELGDPSNPVTPDGGTMGSLGDQAGQLEQDTKQCQQAEATIGPQERDVSNQIQQKSDQMNNLNCNSGGCGGHVSECQSLGDQIKQLCNQDNALMQQIAAACSAFSGGQSSQRNCN